MSSGAARGVGIVLAFAFTGAALPVAAQTAAIRFAQVVTPDSVLPDAMVLVDGDRIVAVRSGAPPPGATVIDLRRYTGLPGLIDAHVHTTYYWNETPGTRPWQQLGTRPAATLLVLAQANLRKALEAGVTTARDLYATDRMGMYLRDLIAEGHVVGPRLVVAGCGLLKRPGATFCGAHGEGPDEVTRVANEQLDAGSDLIKVFGSTGSADDLSGKATHSYEELLAAVRAGHARGKPVTVHSYGPDAARDAVRAGAESVEHAVDLDDATLAEMARRGTIYVPTIDHNRYYAEHRAEFGYSEQVAANLNAFVTRNVETARRAHRAGVRIAMGSDAVFTGFGENARELEWFVRAGMTPAEAVASATTVGAALIGRERDLGRVAPGYLADLIAVEGDPLTDIEAVSRRVRWVMKAGRVLVEAPR